MILKEIITDFGFKVKLSPLSSFLKKSDFDKWNLDICWLWIEKKGLDPIPILNSIKDLTVVVIDQDLFPIYVTPEEHEPQWVLGAIFYYPRIIYICSMYLGTKKQQIKEVVEAIYKHEVSHMVAGQVLDAWTNEDSHPIFSSIGLKDVEKESS